MQISSYTYVMARKYVNMNLFMIMGHINSTKIWEAPRTLSQIFFEFLQVTPKLFRWTNVKFELYCPNSFWDIVILACLVMVDFTQNSKITYIYIQFCSSGMVKLRKILLCHQRADISETLKFIMPFYWQEPPNIFVSYTKHIGYGMWQYRTLKWLTMMGGILKIWKKRFVTNFQWWKTLCGQLLKVFKATALGSSWNVL